MLKLRSFNPGSIERFVCVSHEVTSIVGMSGDMILLSLLLVKPKCILEDAASSLINPKGNESARLGRFGDATYDFLPESKKSFVAQGASSPLGLPAKSTGDEV